MRRWMSGKAQAVVPQGLLLQGLLPQGLLPGTPPGYAGRRAACRLAGWPGVGR